MKTDFCHYCAICGTLNSGPRSPTSSCTDCTESTYLQCPECNFELLGKQFRCPHCQKQFTWLHKKPIAYDKNSKRRGDYRIESLQPRFATRIVSEVNDRLDRHLVIRGLSELNTEVFTELSKFKGELHLTDVHKLQPVGDEVNFPTDLQFLYLDGLEDLSPTRHRAYLNIQVPLSLCGLRHIPRELAYVIRSRKFPTVLNGITQIDESTAEILAETQGKLRLDNLNQTDCPPTLQARFFSNELLSFSDVLTKITPTFAKFLKESTTSNGLSLNGLTDLSVPCARELVGEHKLRLNGLSDLDDDVAEELGKHKGSLVLDNLKNTSETVLQSLTRQPTRLSLKSLKSLPLDGLKSLEKRSNVTLRLFSLKRLSIEKAKYLARLSIHIILDSGSTLEPETVEVLAKGAARFTIKQPESVTPEVLHKISELNATNIVIDTTTELQNKLLRLKENYVQGQALLIELSQQKNFSEIDMKTLQSFHQRLRIVYKRKILFDTDTAIRISRCAHDFVFLETGSLTNGVLSGLLMHPNAMVFSEFQTNDNQCKMICDEKQRGTLDIVWYRNFDLTTHQADVLRKNDRVRVN